MKCSNPICSRHKLCNRLSSRLHLHLPDCLRRRHLLSICISLSRKLMPNMRRLTKLSETTRPRTELARGHWLPPRVARLAGGETGKVFGSSLFPNLHSVLHFGSLSIVFGKSPQRALPEPILLEKSKRSRVLKMDGWMIGSSYLKYPFTFLLRNHACDDPCTASTLTLTLTLSSHLINSLSIYLQEGAHSCKVR